MLRTIYGPLLHFFELGLAVLVLWTIGFRTNQTAQQMHLTLQQMDKLERVNNLRDYLSHRDAFVETLKSIESDSLEFLNIHNLYGLLFHANSTVEFDSALSPYNDHYSLERLYCIYNETCSKLSEASIDQEGELMLKDGSLLNALERVYMLQMSLCILAREPLMLSRKDASGFNPVIPNEPGATLRDIRLVLDAIGLFSLSQRERKVLKLKISPRDFDRSNTMAKVRSLKKKPNSSKLLNQ